jgi:DNA (cytosine-5)-methyltransferase 3A
MNVLSLFNGMNTCRQALENVGIKVGKYYSSEIKPYAIELTQHHFPDTIQLGDVTKIKINVVPLVEVHNFLNEKYFKNGIQSLQSIISKRELLHRINEEQSFAAYFGTQIENESKKISADTTLQVNDRVWFFRNRVDNNKGIYNIIRSGERRKGTNKLDFSELLEHSFWWNGYRQSEFGIEEKSIKWAKRGKEIGNNKKQNKGICDKAISEQREFRTSSSINDTNVSKSRNENETQGIYENRDGRKAKETKSNVNNKERIIINGYENELQERDEINRFVKNNEDKLLIHLQKQITIIECEWGVTTFNGVVELITSGSPCQDLSIAGKQKGINGSRSVLFFTFVDILNHIKSFNPNVLFLQENVGSASTLDVGIMSRALGVYPCRINSSLVTAQLRDRYYWSNIRTKKTMFDLVTDIPQPKDRKIFLKDIITSGRVERVKLNAMLQSDYKCFVKDEIKQDILLQKRIVKGKQTPILVYEIKKHTCLNTESGNDGHSQEYWINRNEKTGMITLIQENEFVRTVNQIEMERLQGFPDGYTSILSKSKAGSLLGDGWTLPVIEHIFKYIPNATI